MSGIEIAGLVLGTIPLVVSALEHYADGVETIRAWRRYKSEVKSLIRRLGVQYDIFRDTLEKLLVGIVSSPGPLLQDPLGPLWKNPELDHRLRSRLCKSYDGYFRTVEDMANAVKGFKRRLGVDEGGKVSLPSRDSTTRVSNKLAQHHHI